MCTPPRSVFIFLIHCYNHFLISDFIWASFLLLIIFARGWSLFFISSHKDPALGLFIDSSVFVLSNLFIPATIFLFRLRLSLGSVCVLGVGQEKPAFRGPEH